MLSRFPVLRSMAAYSVLYPASNLTQQLIAASTSSNKSGGGGKFKIVRELNWKQAGCYMVYGGLIHSQIVYRWLSLLSRLFPQRAPVDIAKIVAVDQVVFAPVALTSFYVGLSLMELKSRDEIIAEWKTKLPKTWATAVFYWPIVQAINFTCIRAKNRAVFVGVMSFFWTIALSFWKSQQINGGDETRTTTPSATTTTTTIE